MTWVEVSARFHRRVFDSTVGSYVSARPDLSFFEYNNGLTRDEQAREHSRGVGSPRFSQDKPQSRFRTGSRSLLTVRPISSLVRETSVKRHHRMSRISEDDLLMKCCQIE